MGGDLSARVVGAMRRWRLVQDQQSLELVARLTAFFDPPSVGRHHLPLKCAPPPIDSRPAVGSLLC
jgi:hypothetical protein